MKAIGNIFCVVVFLWGVASWLMPDKKPTANEIFIDQFAKHQVVEKNEWEKGNVIDNIQIYVASKNYVLYQSNWSLGHTGPGVSVFVPGKEPTVELAFVLSQCNQLVMATLDKDWPELKSEVFTLFKTLSKADEDDNGVKRISGVIRGKELSVSSTTIASIHMFSCQFK